MSSLAYTLSTGNLILHDYTDDLSDLGSSKQSKHLGTDALVASGDYFVTLATALDHLSQSLAKKDQPEHLSLEQIINDLMYLQRNYHISKKS